MGQQSKRTRAPVPQVVPPSPPQLITPLSPHLVPPSAQQVVPPMVPSLVSPPRQPGRGAWIPPRPAQAAAASAPCWLAQPQGPLCYIPENIDDFNPATCKGVDSHPPGGFLSFLKSTPSLSQAVNKGSSSQQIKQGDATNSTDCVRTEKHLLWTKQEDLRLWLEVVDENGLDVPFCCSFNLSSSRSKLMGGLREILPNIMFSLCFLMKTRVMFKCHGVMFIIVVQIKVNGLFVGSFYFNVWLILPYSDVGNV